jgi:hypothetical protein
MSGRNGSETAIILEVSVAGQKQKRMKSDRIVYILALINISKVYDGNR